MSLVERVYVGSYANQRERNHVIGSPGSETGLER